MKANKHITALERKLIKLSFDNEMQDVSTKNKRLNFICEDSDKNYKFHLYSFESGIGIGAKKRWVKKELIINN